MALPLHLWKPTTLAAGRCLLAKVADARELPNGAGLRVELVGEAPYNECRCLYVWGKEQPHVATLAAILTPGAAVRLEGFGVRPDRQNLRQYVLVADPGTTAARLTQDQAQAAGLPEQAEHAGRRTIEGTLQQVVRCTERSAEWRLALAGQHRPPGSLRLVIPRPTARLLRAGAAGARVRAARAGRASDGRCWLADAAAVEVLDATNSSGSGGAGASLRAGPALLSSPGEARALAARCGAERVTADFAGVAVRCPAADPRSGRCEWLLRARGGGACGSSGSSGAQELMRVCLYPGCDGYGAALPAGSRVLLRGVRVVRGACPQRQATAFAGRGCSVVVLEPAPSARTAA